MRVDAVQVFRALGHPTRLAIAEALARRERPVAHLVEMVGSSWSTVSRHLAALRAAGIVDGKKHGNQVIHHLRLPCVATFTRCLVADGKGKRVQSRNYCG